MSLSISELPTVVVQEAFAAFESKEYEKFDALVGENACQVRAAKICKLASTSLSEQDRIFLVSSYLLSQIKRVEVKEHTYTERMDPRYLVDTCGMSKTKANLLILRVQKELSSMSADYVAQSAKSSLKPFVSGQARLQDMHGRSMVPCYFSVKTILREQERILLACKQFKGGIYVGDWNVLFERPKKTKEPYQIKAEAFVKKIGEKPSINPDLFPLSESPAMVIVGYSLRPEEDSNGLEDCISRIKEVPLKTIFLANAAQHMQYASTQKQAEILFDSLGSKEIAYKQQQKMEEHRQIADKIGCSAKNPSLFCIDHIFCAKV